MSTLLAHRSLARAVVQSSTCGAAPYGARNMATLREIELRLKSVRNIEKITKVGLTPFFSFGKWSLICRYCTVDENDRIYKTFEGSEGHGGREEVRSGQQGCVQCRTTFIFLFISLLTTEVFEHVPSDSPTPNKLFIVISSDKGLCGGIHSSVSKATRKALAGAQDSPLAEASENDASVNPESRIMIIGDKSKAQLTRTVVKNFALTFNQIGRNIPTFADAAAVADMITQSGIKYDSVVLIYNKFVSAISYEAVAMHVKGAEALKGSSKCIILFLFLERPYNRSLGAFSAYENEDDATKDLAEFSLANAIYAALTESHACEQSAR